MKQTGIAYSYSVRVNKPSLADQSELFQLILKCNLIIEGKNNIQVWFMVVGGVSRKNSFVSRFPKLPTGWEDTWKRPDLERQLQNLETSRNVTYFQMETEDGKK